MRLNFFSTLLLALIVSAASVSAEDLKTSKTHEVTIKGFEFVPRQLTVHAGDTVKWTNQDIVPHTATAKGGFDSKEIGTTKSWTYRATRKGTFPYTCTYHPTMKGDLTVE